MMHFINSRVTTILSSTLKSNIIKLLKRKCSVVYVLKKCGNMESLQ